MNWGYAACCMLYGRIVKTCRLTRALLCKTFKVHQTHPLIFKEPIQGELQ